MHLWVVITLNFVLFRIVHPVRDPTQLLLDPDFDAEAKSLVQELWGLNEPLFMQYLIYIRNMVMHACMTLQNRDAEGLRSRENE
jgi:ABC-type dipeptide/oligopeptide/nickel transport system permease component